MSRVPRTVGSDGIPLYALPTAEHRSWFVHWSENRLSFVPANLLSQHRNCRTKAQKLRRRMPRNTLNETTHCRCFRCKNPKCGKPMRLPLDTLSRLIVDPEDPSQGVPLIAVLCHQCSQIETYSLQANSSDRFGEDHLVERDQAEDISRPVWLQCDDETCKSHTPLTVTLIPASVREWKGMGGELTALKMEWSGLFCANGHSIPFPQN